MATARERERALGGAHRERSVLRDRPRERQRLLQQGLARQRAVHEPDALGLDAVEEAAGVEELGGLGRADQARERPRRRHSGMEAEAHEVEAELRVARGEPDVARERHAAAGADRGPVHRREGRLRQRAERQEQAVEAAHEGLVAAAHLAAGRGGAGARHALDQVEVAARGEGASGAGDDDRAHRLVVRQGIDRRGERLPHRLAHRVQPLGVVERREGDAVAALEEDEVGHRVGGRPPCDGRPRSA